jgi:hypothetical protein
LPSDKQKRLDEVANAIRHRWGSNALQTPDNNALSAAPTVISTSYPILDKALDIGGIPGGHLTEILGIPTSGVSTLALHIAASTQAVGDTAVYVDLARTFDGEYAAQCGVNLTTLLVVRPRDRQEGLRIARDLIALHRVGVLIFDFGVRPPPGQDTYRDLRLMLPLLTASSTALVMLHAYSEARNADVSEHASLRLRIERDHWLKRLEDIRGWRAQITILKNQFGIANRTVSLQMALGKDAP